MLQLAARSFFYDLILSEICWYTIFSHSFLKTLSPWISSYSSQSSLASWNGLLYTDWLQPVNLKYIPKLKLGELQLSLHLCAVLALFSSLKNLWLCHTADRKIRKEIGSKGCNKNFGKYRRYYKRLPISDTMLTLTLVWSRRSNKEQK